MNQANNPSVEPWLRGTHTDLDALRRQVVHALELTTEDCARWCEPLTAAELNQRPFGLPPVAFQMRHIARSLDRLLTYAEGQPLSGDQLARLRSEMEQVDRPTLFVEFEQSIRGGILRVRRFLPDSYEEPCFVGRDRIPTTAGALLIHCAEHTQRHAGQMVTTAKLVRALRSEATPDTDQG